jgi:hypothetical protein|tara:strand:- start:156 stop:488 length:333 start_codon:yes stop_codon:yes gene_type:complete
MLDTIKNIEMFKDLNIWEFTRELEAIEKITLKGEQDMETKTKNRRARFEFYREKRVSNAVRAIKLCQNMANKNSYDYSAEEGQKIVKYIREALRDLEYAFKETKKTKYFD